MGASPDSAHYRKRRVRPLPLIAGRQFDGITLLEAEINRIRREYAPLNTPLTGDDAALVMEWMSTHEAIDDAVERHGPLQHVEVRWNPDVQKRNDRPEHDRNQLTLVFADGFAEPFGYQAQKNLFGVIKTGYEQHTRQWRWLKTAGRCLIADDIREYRDNHLDADGTCEISGAALSIENAEVHHTGTAFGWMLFHFLKERIGRMGGSAFEIQVIDTDTVGGKRFADEEICEEWIEHHCQEASLQVLDAKVHRQQHAGFKRPPFLELFSCEKTNEDWDF